MKKIYNNNKYMITTIKSCVREFRKQNFDKGIKDFISTLHYFTQNISQVIEHKSYFNEVMITVDEEYIMGVLESITNAQKNREYILLADLIELSLMPLLIQWQEIIQSKEDIVAFEDKYEENMPLLEQYNEELASIMKRNPQIESGYEVEPTTNGSVTVKIIRDNEEFYLLSNNDPQHAGELFADTYYSPRIAHYSLFGMELLNHANALLKEKDAELVDVYESDLNIIKLAVRYGSLLYLPTGRLNIIYDPEYTQFIENSQKKLKNTGVAMHQPSIRNIQNRKIRERFEQLFMVDSSIRNQGDLMLSNFISNKKHCSHYIDELLPVFAGKDVYIIAAGPSLDNNIELLKKKPDNSIILAVGTVYKKLESMGIKPDYVIVSDANRRVIVQIIGVQDNRIPMLILSTAHREFAIRNQGENYLICQQDFKEAKDYADMKHWNLYKAGGSVTTIALDVSIRLQAARVILLGVDLAYTNHLAHATGTSRREHKGTDGLTAVKAMNGGTVYASRSFNMYREWIENRIEQENQIEIIDATEGGALIRGTRICSLEEIIQEASIKNR